MDNRMIGYIYIYGLLIKGWYSLTKNVVTVWVIAKQHPYKNKTQTNVYKRY